ncbi:LETM1-related biofilm-associated protein [Brumimicrobium mesophilum]|uniref:LETM1-related biofilm-associated protein n=1 Tax=Brumimicrobium mesophilum TaxID=392717 RepID=UPI000D143C05|nr:LETM1-related biofilm-associated protein [Brumimicrobium mesophilum]
MMQPGAKNWIDKYFSLIDEKVIDLESVVQPSYISKASFLRNVFFNSGIVFGFPSEFLFFKNEASSKWTSDEKTTFLLFECLLLVYRTEKEIVVKDEFISSLLEFYEQYNNKSSINVLKLLFKEKDGIKLESILKKRVHLKKTMGNQLWVNYLNNSLVYLDVLGFRSFLINQKQLKESYDSFVLGALNTIGVLSRVDHKTVEIEDQILSVYLASANMDDQARKDFKQKLADDSLTIEDIVLPDQNDDLYKFYLLDMAVLTVQSDLSEMSEETYYLNKLCAYLGVKKKHMDRSIIMIERFVMENNHQITFLQEKSSYEQLYGNFSKRWIKILGRNKDKFIEELRESKELIFLVNKSFTHELSIEEKEKVKSQFKDLAKSLPALAIFMLPGGLILLPLILKIIPDLIPSAFKENEVEK